MEMEMEMEMEKSLSLMGEAEKSFFFFFLRRLFRTFMSLNEKINEKNEVESNKLFFCLCKY